MEREENVLKILTVVYIQNGLTLEYTAQVLNLFNSHSIFQCRINPLFTRKLSRLEILSIEEEMFAKIN